MYALIERETNSGRKLYEKVSNLKKIIVFDDTGARIQVDYDCCVRVPVAVKDVDKYAEKL